MLAVEHAEPVHAMKTSVLIAVNGRGVGADTLEDIGVEWEPEFVRVTLTARIPRSQSGDLFAALAEAAMVDALERRRAPASTAPPSNRGSGMDGGHGDAGDAPTIALEKAPEDPPVEQ